MTDEAKRIDQKVIESVLTQVKELCRKRDCDQCPFVERTEIGLSTGCCTICPPQSIDVKKIAEVLSDDWLKTPSCQTTNPNCIIVQKEFEKPTSDSVSVVRCKDCKYFKQYEKAEDFDGVCQAKNIETDKNEFCSYGEGDCE